MERMGKMSKGISLIELIIVVVIIGIIAALAVPRMSRGNPGPAENALSGNMAVWRSALDLYQSEHGGHYPTDSTTLVSQLTGYTDAEGNCSPVKDSAHTYGPYMRAVPPLPIEEADGRAKTLAGSTAVGATPPGGPPSMVVPGAFGWLYDGAGNVYPNTGAATDPAGKLYSGY